MQLRDDPRMYYRTMPNWPPIWLERYAEGRNIRHGEIGTLTHVGAMRGSNKCFLYMTHNELPYFGLLYFDDEDFCSFVAELLKANIGKSIQEIAGLDISPLSKRPAAGLPSRAKLSAFITDPPSSRSSQTPLALLPGRAQSGRR